MNKIWASQLRDLRNWNGWSYQIKILIRAEESRMKTDRYRSYSSTKSFNRQHKRIRAIFIKTCGNSKGQDFASMHRNDGLHGSMTVQINTRIGNLRHAII